MSELFDLVVRNGTLVTGAGRQRADIGIRAGTFAQITEASTLAGSAAEELDATGLVVLPGLIDGHVHFREPGLEHKEDWLTGSRAAVMGGITTVLDMPNTLPPTDSVDVAQLKASLAAAKSYCDFGLMGLVGGDNLVELAPMANSGLVVGFKVFLGDTVGSLSAPTIGDLAMAMASVAPLGFRLGAHAEDRNIVDEETARLRAEGRIDPLAHLASRPVSAEVAAIRTLGRLARQTGCPVHVFHLTSADGLAAVEVERTAGVDMTCEVSAHHCYLSSDRYDDLGGLIKTNPPVREPEHAAALLNGLGDGRIDSIASDHAPHTAGEKQSADIWQVASGIAGVETTLRLFLTHGVHAGRLTLERFATAFAERPAQVWGLWPRKGAIAVGSDADLTIVDLAAEGAIRAAEMHGKNNLTPFEGWPTRGAAVATIVRGKIVMRDGRLLGEPGWGRSVGRSVDARNPE